MPEPLTSDLVEKANALRTVDPWLYLVEVQSDDSNAFRFVANYRGNITFEGFTWTGFPIHLGPGKRSSEGTVDSRRLTVHNYANVVSGLLNAGAFVGRRVRILLVNKGKLGSDLNKVESVYTVEKGSDSEQAVTLTIGVTNPTQLPAPSERFDRTGCRHLKEYGAGRCAYDVTLANLVAATHPSFDPSKCDGSLNGPNGCGPHGDNEVANGRARLHPRQFGAEPGLPGEFRI